MRMLCKYTSYTDYDEHFNETDKSWYLSFVKKDDVIDIPFESKEELEKLAGRYSLKAFLGSERFLSEIREFDDYRDFFGDTDTVVLYGTDIPFSIDEILKNEESD